MGQSEASEQSWSGLCQKASALASEIDLPEDIKVPSQPTALTRFIEMSDDPNADPRELGKVIEQDPGLTIDLLKYVNAAGFGARTPAHSPTDALVRVGIPKARNFLISAGVKSATAAFKSRLMNHKNFWNESLRRALFAQAVSGPMQTDRELAFMGGLLQDFMLPVLTNMHDSEYLEFLQREDSVRLDQWEQERFGWNHAVVGACVAYRWRMPEPLICGILFHHDMEVPLSSPGDELFNLFPVTVAAVLPDQLSQVKDGIEILVRADGKSDRFDLPALCAEVDETVETSFPAGERPRPLSPLLPRPADFSPSA